MPIDWEQHRPPPPEGGERCKLAVVGDRFAGTLLGVRTIKSQYGETPTIKVRLDPDCVSNGQPQVAGEERELFLSFLDLANGVVDAAPDIGDHVACELTAIEKLPSGNERKRATVEVTRSTTGGQTPDASSLLPAQ